MDYPFDLNVVEVVVESAAPMIIIATTNPINIAELIKRLCFEP